MTWTNLYERDGVIVGRLVPEGFGEASGYYIVADADFQKFKVTLFPTDVGTVGVGLAAALASGSGRLASFTDGLNIYCGSEDTLAVGDEGLLTALAKPPYCGIDFRAGFTVQLPAVAVPALRFAIETAFGEAKFKATHAPRSGLLRDKMDTDRPAQLWINDGGFSTAEIERGVQAAQMVLEATGFTSDQAHAAFIAESEGRPHNAAASNAWLAAEAVAIEAASAGWARPPEGAVLVLV